MNQMNFSTAPDGSQSPASAGGSLAGADFGPARNNSLDVGDLLRILSERKYIIIGAALLGLVLGIVASLLMTPLYRAAAMMEVNPSANDMLETSAKGGPQFGKSNSQELLQTQMGLLRNETLARRVVEDLNLASNPSYGGDEGTRQQRSDRATATVLAGTTVEPIKGSMLIQVSHVSALPDMASRIANGISTAFIASSLERRYDSSSYARKFLSDQLARTKTALEESERSLNAYSIESGVFRNPGQQGPDGRTSEGGTLAQADLVALSDALNAARIKRIEVEQAYRNASRSTGAGGVDPAANLRQQRALLAHSTSLLNRQALRDLALGLTRYFYSAIQSGLLHCSHNQRATHTLLSPLGHFDTPEEIKTQACPYQRQLLSVDEMLQLGFSPPEYSPQFFRQSPHLPALVAR